MALNPTDTAALANPSTLTETPLVVGCDSSGVVLQVGSNVKHIKTGDRVASFVFGTHDDYNGAFAEIVKSNAKSSFVLPDGMSHLDGAAFTVRLVLNSPSLGLSSWTEADKKLESDLISSLPQLAHLTAVQALFSRFKG